MNKSTLLAAAVLAIAIGPLAGVRSVVMPQTTSGIVDLLFQRSHATQIGGKAQLASLGRVISSETLDTLGKTNWRG